MKKQYIKPLTTAYGIEVELPLAASPTAQGFSFEGDNGSGVLNGVSATENGDAMSKGHGFDLWGDDEY